MVKDKAKELEKETGESMFDILNDLAKAGHNKASASRILGFSREHFLRHVCPRFDPDNNIKWENFRTASRAAQKRRWDAKPLSELPLSELYQMVEMRNEQPPVPYYVIGMAMGYHGVSVQRWLELYEKHGEDAFTKPRSEVL